MTRPPTETPPPSWFEQHPKTTLLAVFIAFLILLEILIRVLVARGIVPYEHHPTSFKPVFWDDIHPVVGVWRHPNAVYRHTSPCFDVVCSSNAFGMRDPERARRSDAPRRVVVLGDSFIEGFGVAQGERVTDRLESETGIEHLNFGSGGGFGSIQQWLIYEHLAAGFDHSDVFIFMLPCNDFLDNDPDANPADRYRPYLKKVDGTFRVYYPVDFEERQMEYRTPLETIKNIFDNSVYTANFLRWSVRAVKGRLGMEGPSFDADAPGFYDRYTEADLEILLHTYRQILRLAGDRRVYLFTIPIEPDVLAARRDGTDFRLVRALTAFAGQYANLHYHDLLPAFLDALDQRGIPYRDMTLGCDPHWGPLGNRIAAEAVLRVVYERTASPESDSGRHPAAG